MLRKITMATNLIENTEIEVIEAIEGTTKKVDSEEVGEEIEMVSPP